MTQVPPMITTLLLYTSSFVSDSGLLSQYCTTPYVVACSHISGSTVWGRGYQLEHEGSAMRSTQGVAEENALM